MKLFVKGLMEAKHKTDGMLKSWVLFFSLTILLINSLLSVAHAADPLLIVFSPDPPYSVINDKGEPAGMNAELLALMTEDVKRPIQYIICPFGRCLKMIERLDAVLIASVIKTPQRQMFMDYLEPAYYKLQSSYAFYAASDSQVTLRDYAGLSKFLIGYMRGSASFPRFDNDGQLNKIGVKSESLLAELLVKGRVEVGISVENTFDQTIHRLGFDGKIKKLSYKERRNIGAYVAMSKRSKKRHLISIIERTIAKHQKSGRLNQIVRSYGIDPL